MDRYLAMRVYTVPAGKLDALVTRFRDQAVPLFTRHGLDGLGFWVVRRPGTVSDADGTPPDRFAYLLAAPSREHYEASWAAFRADPEWQQARRESERDGPLVATHDEYELESTDFSPFR